MKKKTAQPAERAAALSPVFTGSIVYLFMILGLTPQALCCRPLRGLPGWQPPSDGSILSTLSYRVL